MALTIENIKYSILGKYDFLEATPENVSKLYKLFGKEQFLPNMVQMIQIQQPKNIVTQVSRPQFINSQLQCTITILPDRIDIEAKENLPLDTIVDYITRIISEFELKIQRLALNVNAVWRDLQACEMDRLKRTLIAEGAYPYVDSLIEWSSRNVSRQKWSDTVDEMINVGQNIQSRGSLLDGTLITNQVMVGTDINTLGENMQERFDGASCKDFYENACGWNQTLLDNLKGII